MDDEQKIIDELLALRGAVDIEDNWQALRALEMLPLKQDAHLLQTPSAILPPS